MRSYGDLISFEEMVHWTEHKPPELFLRSLSELDQGCFPSNA